MLFSFNLTKKRIGPNGAIAIAEGLEENKSITKLNLRSNNIDDSGAIAIGNCLSM